MLLSMSLGMIAYQAHAEVDAESAVRALLQIPPMEFYIAKGQSDSCGPGCDTWIAAQGRIVAGTTARLKSLLGGLDRNLPIFLNSPGGDVYESLAFGRLLRQRAMTAGVAITLRAQCISNHTLEECTAAFRENPSAAATLSDDNAVCFSGCTLAVLGATRREIAPNSYLAVHSPYPDLRRATTQQEREQLQQIFGKRMDDEIPRYLSEMGFDPSLYEVAKAVKFGDAHFLLRSELYQRKIDQREALESRWFVDEFEVLKIGYAARKTIALKSQNSDTAFRTIEFSISCDSVPNIFLLTVLELKRPSLTEMRIESSGTEVPLRASDSFSASYQDNPIEVRQAKLSAADIQNLLKSPAIEVLETLPLLNDNGGEHRHSYTISNAGADEALAAVLNRCR